MRETQRSPPEAGSRRLRIGTDQHGVGVGGLYNKTHEAVSSGVSSGTNLDHNNPGLEMFAVPPAGTSALGEGSCFCPVSGGLGAKSSLTRGE